MLSREDVARLLPMDEAIRAVAEAFRALSSGEAVMPRRTVTHIEPHAGIHLCMPCYLPPGLEPLSVKLVTVYPENPPKHSLPTVQGVLLLYEAPTGRLLAVIDAEHLTAMRTGAASGVATQCLARADASRALIFGSGRQAGPQLEAVCTVRPILSAQVLTLDTAEGERLCSLMRDRLGIPVTLATDVAVAIEQADVICTATTSPKPVFDGDRLRPGTHINAVGAFTPSTRELDTATMRRGRVYVDHKEAARAEAGDILIPIAEGAIGFGHIVGEIGEVLIGATPGRTSEDEITVFKSVGVAAQDAATGAHVYAAAVAEGVGQQTGL
jgi:alanine dehydrogenase